MNSIQKTIVSIYAILLVVGIVVDNGIAAFAGSVLFLGTPLAMLLFFIWKSKKNSN